MLTILLIRLISLLLTSGPLADSRRGLCVTTNENAKTRSVRSRCRR